MAGRQCGRSNGGSRGRTPAAGTVGGVNTASAAQAETAEAIRTCAQTQTQEDMPMCRHVNLIPPTVGCGTERQLWELNQVLDYQNKILAELLQTVREMSRNA